MKCRTGFVSNSSSMSFICKVENSLLNEAARICKEHHKIDVNYEPMSVKRIAIEFLSQQIKYYKSFSNPDYNDIITHRKKCLKKLKKSGELDYVVFPACNYDTEIFKLDESTILIFTCNNEKEAWDYAVESLEMSGNMYIKYTEDAHNMLPKKYDLYSKSNKKDYDNLQSRGEYGVFVSVNILQLKRDGKRMLLFLDGLEDLT